VSSPLTGPALADLPLTGRPSVAVALPVGATVPRPVVVALHARGGQPDRECARWRGFDAGDWFVLCPRGTPLATEGRPEGYAFDDSATVAGELRAALAALKARFGPHVAPGPVVVVAAGQSAVPALSLALEEPAFFRHLVLIDGGYDRWTSSIGTRFADRGGASVLFLCSRKPCETGAAASATLADRAGLRARYRKFAANDAALGRALVAELPWLTKGDERFERAPPPAPSASGAPSASVGVRSAAPAP
jgi:hypothetical protein